MLAILIFTVVSDERWGMGIWCMCVCREGGIYSRFVVMGEGRAAPSHPFVVLWLANRVFLTRGETWQKLTTDTHTRTHIALLTITKLFLLQNVVVKVEMMLWSTTWSCSSGSLFHGMLIFTLLYDCVYCWALRMQQNISATLFVPECTSVLLAVL